MLPGRPSDFWSKVPYLFTLLGLAVRASAVSIEPSLIGLDPWHEHVVIGALDAAEAHNALAHHTHLAQGELTISPVEPSLTGGHALVISIVDNMRASLSALADATNDALLAPRVWLLAMAVAPIALALWLAAEDWTRFARTPPPTPPPRFSS